eukprot:13811585-Alexandrium_andersonii.AAC.1
MVDGAVCDLRRAAAAGGGPGTEVAAGFGETQASRGGLGKDAATGHPGDAGPGEATSSCRPDGTRR